MTTTATSVKLSAPYLRYLFPEGVAVVNYCINDCGDRGFFLEPRGIELKDSSEVLIGRFTTEQVIEKLDEPLELGMWGKDDSTTLRELILRFLISRR
jgi:hypothetical protein